MNLGVYRGSGQPVQVAAYETWLGRHVSHVLDFVGRVADGSRNPWRIIDNPSWYFQQWASTPWTLVMSVAAIPCRYWIDSSGVRHDLTLADAAAGKYDAHWARFADAAIAVGQSDCVLRPMWEARVKSWPWCARGQESTYAKAWRRFQQVTASRPGAAFSYDFCQLHGGGINVENVYPGDEYVTTIGLDVYDSVANVTDPKQRWARLHTEPYGLDWLATFAHNHGKPITIGEWGCTDAPTYGGRDNPYYVQQMIAWFVEHDVEFANEFEVNAVDGNHRLMPGAWVNFPKAAAAFLAVT